MTDLRCEQVRERLPELAAARLDGPETSRLEAHLATCASCAEERALLALLVEGRTPVPAGLADRVKAGLRDEAAGASPARWAGRSRRGAPSFPWWGLAAAAVAAVALGVGIEVRGPPPGSGEGVVPSFAMEGAEEELWLSGDGEIAGAPTLDGLSDEALLRFLEELETGGAA